MSLHTFGTTTHQNLGDLSEEHKALAKEIILLRVVADAIATTPPDRLLTDLDRAFVLLAQRIAPHARAERDQRTRLAHRDHCRVDREVDRLEADRLTQQLGALKVRLARGDTDSTLEEIRRLLYELHALTRLHFADEMLEIASGATVGRPRFAKL